MQITVHLTPAAAADVGAAAGLTRALTQLGVQLEPLHPGAADPDLAGQFVADIPDAAADDVCARLLAHPAVVAAYPKPAGGPPSAGHS
jgi:hypothetical protein